MTPAPASSTAASSTTGLASRSRRFNLIAALLWVAAGISFFAVGVLTPDGLSAPFAVVLLVVLVASGAFGVVGLVFALRAVKADSAPGLNSLSTRMVISAGSSIVVAAVMFVTVLLLIVLAGSSTAP